MCKNDNVDSMINISNNTKGEYNGGRGDLNNPTNAIHNIVDDAAPVPHLKKERSKREVPYGH